MRSERITRQSLRILAGHEVGPLALRETLHSMPKARLPKAEFKLTVSLPRVAVLDEIVPIEVQLEHDIGGSTILSLPALYLKSCRTTLGVRMGRIIKRDCDMV